MPNTGKFYLYEVGSKDPPDEHSSYPTIGVVRAECLSCHDVFSARDQPALTNIPGGGAALTCGKCGTRQAISAARFADFMERFPTGSDAAARLTALADDKGRSTD